jgi:hypothetical protein
MLLYGRKRWSIIYLQPQTKTNFKDLEQKGERTIPIEILMLLKVFQTKPGDSFNEHGKTERFVLIAKRQVIRCPILNKL